MLISGPLRFRSLGGASHPALNPADPDRDSDNEVNALRGTSEGISVAYNLNVMLLQHALLAVGALTSAVTTGVVDQATQDGVWALTREIKRYPPQGDEVPALVATASAVENPVFFAAAIRKNAVGLTHYALRLAQLRAALTGGKPPAAVQVAADPFVDPGPAPGGTPLWWYVVGGIAALGAVGLIVHLLRKGARPQHPALTGWGHYGPWTPPRLR